jgi:hypothetical protein
MLTYIIWGTKTTNTILIHLYKKKFRKWLIYSFTKHHALDKLCECGEVCMVSMTGFFAKCIKKGREVHWKFRKLSSNVSYTYATLLL